MSRLIKRKKIYTASEVAELFKKLKLNVKKKGNEWQFNDKHIAKIKKYRLEQLKKYYGDVLEMNYK